MMKTQFEVKNPIQVMEINKSQAQDCTRYNIY